MIQVVANGVVDGAIFALVAVSLTVIFSILRVPHFGLGGLLVWGAFTAYALVMRGGWSFWLALAAATLATAGLGLVVERAAFRRLLAAGEDAMFVAAIGVLIVLENAALLVFGDATQSIPVPAELRGVVNLAGVVYLPGTRLFILGLVAVVYLALHVFVRRTRTGKAMRAVAQDRVAARLLGIPIDRIVTYTFALGSGLAGLAGGILGAAFTFNFETGTMVILRGFVVVVLGGLGSVTGTIVGGVILGLVDSFTQTYITSEFKQLVAFTILILVLVFRPAGLFGERATRADLQRVSV